ncbi:efflux RND transporter periplasmic adaptor subunit [Haloferula chungangensis]|uniref:Efflux RND transporter periplasmic adaptor subunit n=1 Tax=Haloferula chungangensis TaxID=1048331 RepID=A0ABW2LAE3_9BACT
MKSTLWLLAATPLAASPVATAPVESRDLTRQTSQPAIAEALHVADLGSMVTGYVRSVSIDIGDRVKKGQTLATIAVPDYEQRLLAQKAEARRIATDIHAVQARLNAVQAESDRVFSLVKSGTVTSKAGDEVRERLEAAKADLDSAEAELQSAEARTAETQAMLDYATIKAPFDGLVTERSLDPGDLFTAAGKAGADGSALIRIARTDTLRVVLHLPERDAVWADVGDAATLAFDALPGREFETTIARTAIALDGKAQRMRVEFDLPNADGKIPPGLFGRATITLEERANATVIPADALRLTADGPMVYLVENGRVRHQAVSIGLDEGSTLEVTEGLKGGDLIVTGRIERLADGAEVETR